MMPIQDTQSKQITGSRLARRGGISMRVRLEKILRGGILILAAVVFLGPFYWLLISSFKTREEIFQIPPNMFPFPPTFDNFRDVFHHTMILRAFLNSCVIAFGHVALTLFFCSLAGFAFAKYPRAPGNKFLFACVLGTMMIPGAVTTIPVFIVLTKLKMVNTFWALIIPGSASAFGIFWMRQSMMSQVPNELLEAARIDGCSEFGIYARVVLPISKPVLAALGILTLIRSWNNLMMAFIVLRTESMYTMPLMIYMLLGELRTPYGMMMAGGVLITAPLIVAFLLFQRQFIQGMTAGALKG
ncbi:carbohydrate ABC transporter permease [Candidatus Sumerlaeota bacterium]|nr:carbohydrate ABC transporter permease [Candidatus Sumerlaeota bacterium]